jgi:hypothetical protein
VAGGVAPFRISVAVSGAPAGQLPATLIAADASASNGGSKETGTGKRANPRRSGLRFAQRCSHHQRLTR